MNPRIGEGEAKQQGVRAENVAEGLDDGDAAAFADEDGLGIEGPAKRVLGGEAVLRIGVGDVGLAVMTGLDLDLDAARAMGFEVFFHLFHDILRALIRDEPEGKFHESFGRDHRLGAFSLIARTHAIDLGCRACPNALGGGVSRLAEEAGRAGDCQIIRVAHAGKGRSHFALPSFQGPDLVVKSLDGDLAFEAVQARHQPRHGGSGIRHDPAEEAGVEVAFRAAQNHLAASEAAQTVAESRHAGSHHSGVGNGDDVAFQLIEMIAEERCQIWAADFLLAFK